MKRVNNLIEQVADMENIRLAFWKARKGKSWAKNVQIYQKRLEKNLFSLRKQILHGDVDVGNYRYFKVFDPKERRICASAFNEQVLHHAIMNICHDHFEKAQIFDSYASRPGKGVHAALRRAAIYNKTYKWFIKLDIRKFFESIHHNILKRQLERIFKDYRLLDVFSKIIDSYKVEFGKGVPIGNLSSQYFANHYLSCLDHFIKEQLNCKAYVRYMDDFVLWHSDKRWLIHARNIIKEFVETKVCLKLNPDLLNQSKKGLPFCGHVIYPHYVKLSQRSKRRYIKKLKYLNDRYQSGDWEEAICQRRLLPLVAFTRYADSLRFRKNALSIISYLPN